MTLKMSWIDGLILYKLLAINVIFHILCSTNMPNFWHGESISCEEQGAGPACVFHV